MTAWPLAGLVGVAGAVALLADYQATLAGFVGLAALVTLGLVLLTGIAGQISFGQASFAGIAAYASAGLTTFWGAPTLAGLAAGLALTGATAWALGFVTTRLSGHYLSLGTIAWSVSFFYLFGTLPGLGGFNGFGEIPPPGAFGLTLAGRPAQAALIWLAVALVVALFANLLDSRQGRAMRALAHSRVLAESVGIDAARLGRAVFVLAALPAGLSGWLFVHFQRYINPGPFGLTASIEYVFMAIIGGVGQLGGALLGAGVVVVLRDQLNDLLPRLFGQAGNFEAVAFALIVMLLLHRAPGGIAPLFARWFAPPARLPRDAPALPRRPMPPCGRAVLEVDGVTRRFGGLVAVDGASFSVHAGEILALIGPNGAGKSTMFNVASGILRPSSGAVRLLGGDITARPARAIAALGLARSFQHVRLLAGASVVHNIALGAQLRGRAGLARAALRLDRADEAGLLAEAARHGARVGLGEDLLRPAGDLPLGRQRLVEIARALCLDPCVLLLDEPAAGLRLQEKQALATLLRALRAEGMAILLVEHDMAFVMDLADRVVVMDFGRTIASGRPDAVQRDPAVIEAYLGSVA